jgi:UDP-glucose 4-epimerase
MCLVTGGLGYIGSHTALDLLKKDYHVVILDNLSNSQRGIKKNIEQLAGRSVAFIEGSVGDQDVVQKILSDFDIQHVIHFAASKFVPESIKSPDLYYDNNVVNLIKLLDKLKASKV